MENKGLIKKYWQDVREQVAKVEPSFAKKVDELSPGNDFPVYLAYYPYGATDADTISTLLPDGEGGYYRLTDASAPKDVVRHLGYSQNNTPFGMVLEKQIESFIDLNKVGVTIPWIIYTPGKMFPLTRILNAKHKRIYAPNGLLSSVAGSRSTFMLPNIGCATNHVNLQRDFNVRQAVPKQMYEHWGVFKEIVGSNVVESDWRCCVMYFSESWINKILHDQAWVDLKKYLHEVAWHQFEYEINRVNYDIIFSIIQRENNLKPNPYLADTAKHLFATAIGSAPGYAPVINEDALPLKLIQQAYVDSYGLKKYLPTIMAPTYFDHEASDPIYYSLQHPSTYVFSPKSREASSTLFEMRELEYIMKIFANHLSNDSGMCGDTIVGEVARKVDFDYFHNKKDQHGIVRQTTNIAEDDKRFSVASQGVSYSDRFASDSPFLRGCVRTSASYV